MYSIMLSFTSRMSKKSALLDQNTTCKDIDCVWLAWNDVQVLHNSIYHGGASHAATIGTSAQADSDLLYPCKCCNPIHLSTQTLPMAWPQHSKIHLVTRITTSPYDTSGCFALFCLLKATLPMALPLHVFHSSAAAWDITYHVWLNSLNDGDLLWHTHLNHLDYLDLIIAETKW